MLLVCGGQKANCVLCMFVVKGSCKCGLESILHNLNDRGKEGLRVLTQKNLSSLLMPNTNP